MMKLPETNPNMFLSLWLVTIPLRCFLENLNLWFAWLHVHSLGGHLKSIWLDFGSKKRMEHPRSATISSQESQKEHDALSAELKQEQQHLASQREAATGSFGWFMSVPQRIRKMNFDSWFHLHTKETRWWDEVREGLSCCRAVQIAMFWDPQKDSADTVRPLCFSGAWYTFFYWMCWGSKGTQDSTVLGSSVSFLCMFELQFSFLLIK